MGEFGSQTFAKPVLASQARCHPNTLTVTDKPNAKFEEGASVLAPLTNDSATHPSADHCPKKDAGSRKNPGTQNVRRDSVPQQCPFRLDYRPRQKRTCNQLSPYISSKAESARLDLMTRSNDQTNSDVRLAEFASGYIPTCAG